MEIKSEIGYSVVLSTERGKHILLICKGQFNRSLKNKVYFYSFKHHENFKLNEWST